METVELKVEMYGIHSEKRIRRCLSKLRGVKMVEVELRSKKVVIRGDTDERRIVKALRRTGFRSEPWCSKTEMLLTAYNGGKYRSLWIINHFLF
ncbi:heavy metal-associated isoprenylated plant protein 28-like [Nymphaea colorata]|nr:heavy metal-associated isoprenylated plant protein 28-like [Nymphaea colorata]XP_031503291.1 heavy metal-associated isoprenylated plant protein 28-like [Nymphaea colorata]XP_031503292.1 heavy metal-associated isoprenylated plant protein 28-like [Nymphaea colorata]XP_049936947.1 heavy metal-associated isoprenylated plant protein 28-like [Nymphaea colorata]